MKVPLRWLAEYVDLTVEPRKLADDLTLVGLAVDAGARGRRARQLFFYSEGVDRLMVVPEEFARFADFVAETRRRSPAFRDLELASGETLKERLRSLVTPSPPSTPPSAAGSPPPADDSAERA